jgi:hypothetical protein
MTTRNCKRAIGLGLVLSWAAACSGSPTARDRGAGGFNAGGNAGGGTSGNANGAAGGKTSGSATGGSGGGAGGSATGGAASSGTGGGMAGGNDAGAAGSGFNGGGGASGGRTFKRPPANASWDYQLGGPYTPPAGVQVVGRDRTAAPAPGLYNICYINGFQIQPHESSFWSSQHPTLILKDAAGNPVIDADWNETLLDTSTAAKRNELAAVLGTWIAKCKGDGFDAVDIDNLDSYARSKNLLTPANNVALMALLSTMAHQNGLAISQKNASDLLGSVAMMGTDFAVVEECNRYSECEAYTAAYGNLVFIVEYRQQDFQTGCTKYPQLSIVLRDLELSTPASGGYVYQGC